MKSILVIEDDLNVRESISELLTYKKYSVTTAKNGEEGLLLAKQGKPDLVICDVMMPGTDGYDVLRQIRTDKSIANTPFMFLSAKTQYNDVRQGMNIGADDYLTKPFKADDLFEAVNGRLNRQNAIKKEYGKKMEIIKPLEEKMVSKGLEYPLRGIMEFSQMLMKHFEKYTAEEIRSFVKKINNSAYELHKKINNISLFQALEKSNYDNSVRKSLSSGSCTVDTAFIKELLIASSVVHGREDDLFIKNVVPQKVKMSKENLKLIIEELFDNAFRHSNRGQLVEVNSEVNDKFYQLEIFNSGKPINTDQLDEKSSKKIDGGIGLMNCSQLMKLNGAWLMVNHNSEGKNIVTLRFKV